MFSKIMKNKYFVFMTIGILSLLGKIVGFVRELVIANEFGTTIIADNLSLLLSIPTYVYLIVGGALSTSVVIFANSKDNNTSFLKGLKTIYKHIGIASICLFMLILSFYFVYKESIHPSILIIYWSIPVYVFLSLRTSLFNIISKPLYPQVALIILNAVFVILIYIVPLDFFKWDIYVTFGLAFTLSTFIGCLSLLLMKVLFVSKNQIYIKPKKIEDKEMKVKEFWSISLPIIFGGASLQINNILQRMYATNYEEGVVSAVNYSTKLVSIPQGMMLVGIGAMIFPLISRKIREDNISYLKKLYYKLGLSLFVLFSIVSLIMFVYSNLITKLVFMRGEFDLSSVNVVSDALGIYAFTIPLSLIMILQTRFLYGFKMQKMVNYVSLLFLVVVSTSIFYVLKDTTSFLLIPYINIGILMIMIFIFHALLRVKLNTEVERKNKASFQ
ncbi:lipid II flippase MurJ [Metabacillus sp. JX24]|uniref:lipid II flippase MurJ n=1 Tax=Metabacillus sp. JX24 TaxID=3240759 RepID=UPI003510730C